MTGYKMAVKSRVKRYLTRPVFCNSYSHVVVAIVDYLIDGCTLFRLIVGMSIVLVSLSQ